MILASPRLRAALQALFVTFLWSTSWVLIKLGLQDIPALTFAGLRYVLAALCLLPFVLLRPANRSALRRLTRKDWLRLVALGLVMYTVTQGAQFLGLFYLPTMTVNLLLNLTSVVVALLGLAFLSERPALVQWGGMAVFLAGAVIYFHPLQIASGQTTGFVVVACACSATRSRRSWGGV